MKWRFGKILGLVFVLILTSPVTIGVWMVNDKSLLGTLGEITESNRDIFYSQDTVSHGKVKA